MTRCSHHILYYKPYIILPGSLIHLGKEGRGILMELSEFSLNRVTTDRGVRSIKTFTFVREGI